MSLDLSNFSVPQCTQSVYPEQLHYGYSTLSYEPISKSLAYTQLLREADAMGHFVHKPIVPLYMLQGSMARAGAIAVACELLSTKQALAIPAVLYYETSKLVYKDPEPGTMLSYSAKVLELCPASSHASVVVTAKSSNKTFVCKMVLNYKLRADLLEGWQAK